MNAKPLHLLWPITLAMLAGCFYAEHSEGDKKANQPSTITSSPIVDGPQKAKKNTPNLEKSVPAVGASTLALIGSSQPMGPFLAASALYPGRTEPKRIPVAKSVTLEISDKRRVLLDAQVCLRQGMLEQLLCKKATKEHEAILSADADAKDIHAALLVAGATPGAPVQFRPEFKAAHGTVIKVYLQFEDKGKTIKIPAQEWVRSRKTNKELQHDWVFAGSVLYGDPNNPKSPPYYAANQGDVICVTNMDAAMLDLPISTSKDYEDLDFEAFTERIPQQGTSVLVILEPVLTPLPKKK